MLQIPNNNKYNLIVIYVLCMMNDVWWLGSNHELYFDMFYIHWHHLAKMDLWNKEYILNSTDKGSCLRDMLFNTCRLNTIPNLPIFYSLQIL
jgi:hypothetical protein